MAATRQWLEGLVVVVAVLILSTHAAAAPCTDYKGNDGHRVTITNSSGEPVVIGVFGTEFNLDDKPDDNNPFKGYTDPSGKNWNLAAGDTMTWCAPKHFNGRFFARTGCADGVCETGNCCINDPKKGIVCSNDNKCSVSPEPTTLAEVFFDSKQGTFYDVSLVDGYDFGMTMVPTKPDTVSCKLAGCTKLPPCPWGVVVDGICYGPYKRFELGYYDHKYQPSYYVLAAMCAQEESCGCGNQCTADPKMKDHPCPTIVPVTNPFTNQSVQLISSGCSPLPRMATSSYKDDVTAQQQITCDPEQNSTDTVFNLDPTCTGPDCRKIQCHPWPAYYKEYITRLNKPEYCGGKDQGVYTWQYRDDAGLFKCGLDANDGSDPLGFAITLTKRLPNDTETPRATKITFAPSDKTGTDPAVSGLIWKRLPTADGFTSKLYQFQGPQPVSVEAKNGDVFSIFVNCRDQGFSMNCNFIYKDGQGFVVDPTGPNAPACKNTATYAWHAKQIGLGYPAYDSCTSENSINFLIAAAPKDQSTQLTGHICIGAPGAESAKLITFTSDPNTPAAFGVMRDKEQLVLVENCGTDAGGNQLLRRCSATLDMSKGLLPDQANAAEYSCNSAIDWSGAFSNKRLGLGYPAISNCIKGVYKAECTATYSQQDAKTGLLLHQKRAADHSDPVKLDTNGDGKIDLIDSVNMLRRSMGL